MAKSLPIFIVVALLATFGATAEETVEGLWLVADGDGLVRISLVDGNPVGVIAGSVSDQEERKDELNPDPALRDRSLMGLQILGGFRQDGDGRWKKGRIYDPNNGKTYKCNLRVVDKNRLEVRGYIGVSWVGRSEEWTRHLD